MRKLFAFLLAVCLLLPACAPAEDRDPIIGCWAFLVDGEKYPEFMQNFGDYDSMMAIYYFLSDGTVMLLENDMKDKAAQPVFASVGVWEKTGDVYSCSIIGLGSCSLSFWAESLMIAPEQNPGVSMKLRLIRPFNPYSDYSITR